MVEYRLCILVLSALFCEVYSECDFSCTGERSFITLGVAFNCPSGKVCNKFNAYNDCKPCISESLKCRNHFRCPSYKPDDVIIGGVQVKCPDQYKCNSKGEGVCPPCIHKGCAAPIFQCDPDDEEVVTVMNMQTLCQSGTVCNKNNLPPCYPCIDQTRSNLSEFGAYYLD